MLRNYFLLIFIVFILIGCGENVDDEVLQPDPTQTTGATEIPTQAPPTETPEAEPVDEQADEQEAEMSIEPPLFPPFEITDAGTFDIPDLSLSIQDFQRFFAGWEITEADESTLTFNSH